MPIIAYAEDRFLHYMWSEATVITISNVDCPFKEIKKEYHKVGMATNIMNGDRIFGCYKPEINDMIKIQWYKGDFSAFPANAFLINNVPEGLKTLIESKVELAPTL